MLLDDVSELADESSRLDSLNGFLQTLAGSLDDAHTIGVCLCLVANVVGLVQVGVIPLVVEGNVNVEDIAVDKDSLIGNAMADDFV